MKSVSKVDMKSIEDGFFKEQSKTANLYSSSIDGAIFQCLKSYGYKPRKTQKYLSNISKKLLKENKKLMVAMYFQNDYENEEIKLGIGYAIFVDIINIDDEAIFLENTKKKYEMRLKGLNV